MDQTTLTMGELKQMGYRIVSRKYGMISRVDRPDWKEFMRDEKRVKPNADFYRRVYSKDTLELGRKVIGKIPTSDWDETGYVDVKAVASNKH